MYDAFEQLGEQYKGDIVAVFRFNQALYSFIKNGRNDQSDQLLAMAHQSNKYVIDYLLFNKNPPDDYVDKDYVSLGGEDEAVAYVMENMDLWHQSDELMAWLNDFRKPN